MSRNILVMPLIDVQGAEERAKEQKGVLGLEMPIGKGVGSRSHHVRGVHSHRE